MEPMNTVLLPTTENKEEQSVQEARATAGDSDAQSGKTPAK